MKVERFISKALNRQGYFWVVKLETMSAANELKQQMGFGRGYIYQNMKSKNPFWVLAATHNHFEVE